MNIWYTYRQRQQNFGQRSWGLEQKLIWKNVKYLLFYLFSSLNKYFLHFIVQIDAYELHVMVNGLR